MKNCFISHATARATVYPNRRDRAVFKAWFGIATCEIGCEIWDVQELLVNQELSMTGATCFGTAPVWVRIEGWVMSGPNNASIRFPLFP